MIRLLCYLKITTCIAVCAIFVSCAEEVKEGTFAYDLEVLKDVKPTILKAGDAQIAVVGEFQGRIMTSTSKGLQGTSYGFFQREMFRNGTYKKKYAAIGGEGRIWFGPEFGKYSVVFKPGDPQDDDHIARSVDLDTVDFKMLDQSERSVSYGNNLQIRNYQNYLFQVEIERRISLFNKTEIEQNLACDLPESISCVGFIAETSMKNIGEADWEKESGLLSLWDISCIVPSPKTVLVFPVRNNPDSITNYFTPLNDDRIKLKDGNVFYKADANYLNKIGIQAQFIKPVYGSYSPELNLLTINVFKFEDDSLYVNSHAEYQDNPYGGDVINVFNDGVIGDIGPFGPFYEMETSSSAKELKVGESHSHWHAIYHFEGEENDLNKIAEKVLGVNLEEIKSVFE